MEQWIDMVNRPAGSLAVMEVLLQDKTTDKNIVWATDTYAGQNARCTPESQILQEQVMGAARDVVHPRIAKAAAEQAARTKRRAEVFTPAWICCKMADALDAEWFGRENVFFTWQGNTWQPTAGKIEFAAKGKTWQRYVDSRRLEITCGEAPFLASRYDAAAGEAIAPTRRVGLLDRKLRVVGENTETEADWLRWAARAMQSVYGYEYQGDSLLMARFNLLQTVADAFELRWQKPLDKRRLKPFAAIAAWNLWQMDGLTGRTPYPTPEDSAEQTIAGEQAAAPPARDCLPCKIYDWRKKQALEYLAIARKEPHTMKFDYAIGNGSVILGIRTKNVDFRRVSGLREPFLIPFAA